MNYKMIKNDILKSKLITITTILFVTTAAFLISASAIMATHLLGSIDHLMVTAKSPHFMQMHSGSIDYERLNEFATEHSNVDSFQILEFLNVDMTQIKINNETMAGSAQDNGFSTQSPYFDYLLDLDNRIIQVNDGEVYVPLCYMKDHSISIGDTLSIGDYRFTVKGFLRDSQMNSTLSTSKRFIISEKDYQKIYEYGNVEYLIEFRLIDSSKVNNFESEYISAGLEMNGPTLTYPLFKMINAISDGIMIAVILLISILVVSIAFMCIRFTLLAKIEDDYREIGVMKAIGLKLRDIKKIYLSKYSAIALIGCSIGLILSLLLKDVLVENIRLYMGESKNVSLSYLFGLIGVIIVFLSIVVYVNFVLRRFKKISAANAIRFGGSQEKTKDTKRFILSTTKLSNTNIFLGIKDVLIRKKLYLTLLVVIIISSFILIVPQNLYQTISSKSFVNYMGVGNYDIQIGIQQTTNILQKVEDIEDTLKNDETIASYSILTTKSYQVIMDDGTIQNIKIDIGDHSIFPLEYSKGTSPFKENEIALSSLNSDELEKTVGDTLTIIVNGANKKFIICGIYSDLTNGGKTAKATYSDASFDVMWVTIGLQLTNSTLIESKVTEYSNSYEFAKVLDIEQYRDQVFGSTLKSVRVASFIAVAIALIMTAFITLLFIKMIITKDKHSIATLKAIGFSTFDIIKQYTTRALFVLIIGIVTGTLLANTLGKLIVGVAISYFGASTFNFIINPIIAYLLSPLMMANAAIIATMLGTKGIEKYKISEHIKE